LGFALTFSNTDPANLGDFAGQGFCIDNPYDQLSGQDSLLSPSLNASPGDGVHRRVGGGLTIGGAGPVIINGQTVIVVDGDVTITGNIVTATTGITGVDDIPAFVLIVRGGNIIIADGVTRLDGLYYAIPSVGTGGEIFTCQSANCSQQLVINGAFVAQNVEFRRTFGAVSNPGNCPVPFDAGCNAAELFRFNPLLYLATIPGFNNGGGGVGQIRSFRDLPPIVE
jgi:hypothetical protein